MSDKSNDKSHIVTNSSKGLIEKEIIDEINEEEHSDLDEKSESLTDRLYLSTSIIIPFFRYVSYASIISLVILIIAFTASNYYFSLEMDSYGKIDNINDPKTGNTKKIFVPFEDNFSVTGDSLVVFDNTIKWLGGTAIFVVIVLGWLLIWARRTIHSAFNELEDLNMEFIQQSYLMSFEVQTTKGKTRNEKILNHLMLVFPELKKAQSDALKKKDQNFNDIAFAYKINQQIAKYPIDIIVPIKYTGELIIKFYDDILTYDELKKLTKALRKHEKIFRVICVSPKYEKLFFEESVENSIDDLKPDFKLDLVLEKKRGYSMIWID